MENSLSLRMEAAQNAAHTYAKWGWNVFPVHSMMPDGSCSCKKTDCSKKGKHPMLREWPSKRTTDLIQIDNWWKLSNGFVPNIGIVTGKCSGITVIDIDPRHGGDKTWENIAANIDIPDTYTVKTGGGGWHLYFKYCPDLHTSTNAFGEGVDIRNDGGFVIAPPSNHASSPDALYQPLSPIDFSQPDLAKPALAEVPSKLCNFVKKAKVKDVTPDKASLEKVKKLLEFISSEDYDTWFKTGIILGSTFNRSDEAWNVYCAWSDKGWDKKNPKDRNRIMKDAFYDDSQKEAPNGKNLSIKTLFHWAYQGGYTDVTNNFDANLFCYLASENVFIFMPTGEKWISRGVNNTVKPIKLNDEYIEPSQWLANNKAAVSMITDGSIPYGLIDGYYSKEGRLFKLPNTRVLNIFNFNDFKPLRALKPKAAPNNDQPPKPRTEASGQQVWSRVNETEGNVPQQTALQQTALQQTALQQTALQQTALQQTALQQIDTPSFRSSGRKKVFKVSTEVWAKLNA